MVRILYPKYIAEIGSHFLKNKFRHDCEKKWISQQIIIIIQINVTGMCLIINNFSFQTS